MPAETSPTPGTDRPLLAGAVAAVIGRGVLRLVETRLTEGRHG